MEDAVKRLPFVSPIVRVGGVAAAKLRAQRKNTRRPNKVDDAKPREGVIMWSSCGSVFLKSLKSKER